MLKDNRRQYYRHSTNTPWTSWQAFSRLPSRWVSPMTANRVGSMFTFFFTDEQVTDWDSAATCDTAKFGRFHNAMLNAGIWLPPSQFEAAFLSVAHTPQHIEQPSLPPKKR